LLPLEKQAPAFLSERLTAFHAAATFPMRKHNRKGDKLVDAKQYMTHVALTTPHTLSLEVAMTNAGTLNPQEFLGVLLSLSAEESKVLRVTKVQTVFHSQPTGLTDAESEADMQTDRQAAPLLSAAG
jgi:hypothetical protein